MPNGTKRDTEQVKQLQVQIKSMQKQLGWTNTQLANAIYCELFEEDDDDGMQKFAETLKKQLKRDSTPTELLQRYIQLISRHQDYRRAGLIVATPIRLGVVDFQILRAVSAASQKLITDNNVNEVN